MCFIGLFSNTMLSSSLYETVPLSFFQRENVVQIARELVGLYLIQESEDGIVGGKIVETEAYCGAMDRACHAFGKKTPRTEVMYGVGGTVYVYLCYGMYHLFNIVTNQPEFADAVLIRAIEPVWGMDVMRKRTGKGPEIKKIASGPGLVGKAMNFHRNQTGLVLGDAIQVLKRRESVAPEVDARQRIGVEYAGEDSKLPWRFILKGNPFVSKK
jgi:DNA-3-methyladenine glycosylase